MKCLVADTMHESLMPMLQEIGFEVDYEPSITRDLLREKLRDYEGLVIRSKTTVDADLLKNADKLMFVARAGAGIDKLDEEELKRRNIQILNAPEGNRNAVGEQTLGMLLALMHNIVKADREVSNKVWDREGNRGMELCGRTVGIIGYGFMGMAFARKLTGLGCRVLAYDKYKSDFSDDYCEESSLDQLFSEAEIISLHIPLTEETKNYVNADFLNQFRNPVILLNTARGGILELNDLLEALENGKVLSAGLDVLENEKLQHLSPEQERVFEKLAGHPRIILTPHVAGWTFESYVRINEILSRKISRLLEEKP